MEGACSLSVPLVAHPRWGTKWGSMAPMEGMKISRKLRRFAGAGADAGAAQSS
ncbi:unnamed protein product [Ectocarpus sp. 8 AP-2014]